MGDNCDLFIETDGVYSTMVTTTAAPMLPSHPNMKCKKDWGFSLMEKGLQKPQDCLDQAKTVASDGPLVFSFCKPAVGTICTVYTGDCEAKAHDGSGSLRSTGFMQPRQAIFGRVSFESHF